MLTAQESLKLSLEHSGLSDPDSYTVNLFEQSWPSTALGFGGVGGQASSGAVGTSGLTGFGGVGGQAFTRAYTVVIEDRISGDFSIYFDGRFAYRVENPNLQFYGDIACSNLHAVRGHEKRYCGKSHLHLVGAEA